MERDAVIDLAKYVDQRVRVKFSGGREVEGLLKGFDKLDNLGTARHCGACARVRVSSGFIVHLYLNAHGPRR
jgi:hypothetical protein